MDRFKYLIVGGGVAGVTAAEMIRERDLEGSVGLVNDEPYTLYSRVMLSKPNFFLEKIPFEKVWLKGTEWYQKNNISFIGGKRAVGLDAVNKVLSLADGAKLGYEKLLLATGVCARRWNVPGADKRGVFHLRTLEDGKSIIKAIKSVKRAATVGGGFISFEMADMLKLAGLDVAVVIREAYFWEPILNEVSGLMVEKAMTGGGVRIVKNAEVREVAGGETAEAIVLKNGTKIPCEMIVCGIGVVCPNDWLQSSGIKTAHGILTNEYLETSLPDVWAAGDAAEYKDLILEETVQMGNWVSAHEQGRIAAQNMVASTGAAGLAKEPFRFVSFYTTQGFGIAIAFVGDTRPGPDRIVIERGSPKINSYGQIIIVGKELVGATLINRSQELTEIAKLIQNNVDVSTKRKELSDPNFDLKLLL